MAATIIFSFSGVLQVFSLPVKMPPPVEDCIPYSTATQSSFWTCHLLAVSETFLTIFTSVHMRLWLHLQTIEQRPLRDERSFMTTLSVFTKSVSC